MTIPSFANRLASALAAAGLTASLAACVTTQDMARTLLSNPQKVMAVVAPKELSADEEKQVGLQSSALLLGAAPLVRDDALNLYVNKVGRWVAQQAGRPDIEWRFGVIDTPNVNAFAAPSGYIFVTRGLLARLDNESELAGVLAHEIAHVVERHYVLAMQKRQRSDALAGLASDAASGNRFLVDSAINLSRGIYSAGLDKGDEFDADRIGLTLAARAGYHPWGLPRVLQMYAGHAQESGFDLFFSTHPAPGERLDRLDALMDKRFADLEAGGVKQTAAFNLALNRAPDPAAGATKNKKQAADAKKK